MFRLRTGVNVASGCVCCGSSYATTYVKLLGAGVGFALCVATGAFVVKIAFAERRITTRARTYTARLGSGNSGLSWYSDIGVVLGPIPFK